MQVAFSDSFSLDLSLCSIVLFEFAIPLKHQLWCSLGCPWLQSFCSLPVPSPGTPSVFSDSHFPCLQGPCWPSAEHSISCLAFSGNHPWSLFPVSCEALIALTRKLSLLSHSCSGFETSLALNLSLFEFYLLLPLFSILFLSKVSFAY